jgi:outer membrane murein-binding lipoprotein Lpp
MKKNMKLALLILATGLVLAGCAGLNQKVDGLLVRKWDKNEKSTAYLYFDEDVRIHSIDGKANVNIYGQTVAIDGSGTQKAPKMQLAIPAGERKIVMSFSDSTSFGNKLWEKEKEVTYNFVAGRYYQLSPTNGEPDAQAVAAAQEELQRANQGINSSPAAIAEATKKVTEAQNNRPMNLEIIDISGGKKKNSPSIVIVIK